MSNYFDHLFVIDCCGAKVNQLHRDKWTSWLYVKKLEAMGQCIPLPRQGQHWHGADASWGVPHGYTLAPLGPMWWKPCLSCPDCVSVTLVYCGQTVGWIKMKLGTEVGLGFNHVLDEDPAPPKKHSCAPFWGGWLGPHLTQCHLG